MEQNNCLGVYLAKDSATAVVLAHKGSHVELTGCFTVTARTDDESETAPSLAAQVAQTLAAKRIAYGDVAVTIDCASYTQHNLHSDFTDHKQIANTIAFDAEEALACDATETALTFNVTGTDDHGSTVTVFTADRHALDEQLRELQRQSLDPTAIEPDIVCLARYVRQGFTLPKESNPMFVIASAKACYIVNLQDNHRGPLMRSFILGESQDLASVLRSQIPLTIASLKPERPIDGLFIAPGPHDVDLNIITESTGIEAHIVDLPQMTETTPGKIDDCRSEIDFAIAYGAAIAEIKRIKPSDFRQSFAPYQGKRRILQRSLRAISVFATISLVALGVYFQLKVFRVNNYTSELNTKLKNEFAAATYNKRLDTRRAVSRQLKSVLTEVKSRKSKGFGDEDSVTAKLTYTLDALNSSPKSVDLKIGTISITRAIKVTGDTNSRASTLAMLKSFKDKGKLEKTSERISGDRGRDKFELTFDLKKATR